MYTIGPNEKQGYQHKNTKFEQIKRSLLKQHSLRMIKNERRLHLPYSSVNEGLYFTFKQFTVNSLLE